MSENFNRIVALDSSRELKDFVEKRFTTSFIGAIDSVEQHLYDLFSDEEWKKYWPPLREEILNKGNSQKRLALKELDKYEHRKKGKHQQHSQQSERNFNR